MVPLKPFPRVDWSIGSNRSLSRGTVTVPLPLIKGYRMTREAVMRLRPSINSGRLEQAESRPSINSGRLEQAESRCWFRPSYVRPKPVEGNLSKADREFGQAKTGRQ